MIRKLALLVLALSLGACATTKALDVACVSARLLIETGMCNQAARLAKAERFPACPDGQRWEILNYQAWSDGEEAPRVACRSYSIK
jgi:hypothetical protein